MGSAYWRLWQIEPVRPYSRPNGMKNIICTIWHKVADWIDAVIELYDWITDMPGPNNRFAKPDKILASPKKSAQ